MAFAQSPGWYVISLRPQGQHGALRRAAARRTAGLLALSPWRLQPCGDDDARTALRCALEASRVVFTSPAAVRSALALQALRARPSQHWIAVGSATAAALRRAGVAPVQSPPRMDSEGLLQLPALNDVDGLDIGLVTAPQGRDLLSSTLAQRGARVLRAEVYRRVPMPLSARALGQLRALDRPACIALTSSAALELVLGALPPELVSVFTSLPAVAASERLQQFAVQAGLSCVERAEGPRPAQLLAAMVRCFR